MLCYGSDKKGETFPPKVQGFLGQVILPGLVGTKARPKGVVDGKQVNIPVPLYGVTRGVEKGSSAG